MLPLTTPVVDHAWGYGADDHLLEVSMSSSASTRRLLSAPGVRFQLATRVALVAVLLAQAVAIVIAEPWPEGGVLLTLSRDHGVTEGDLPAVALIMAAVLTALLSHPRMLRRR